jgi:hypothetical protein
MLCPSGEYGCGCCIVHLSTCRPDRGATLCVLEQRQPKTMQLPPTPPPTWKETLSRARTSLIPPSGSNRLQDAGTCEQGLYSSSLLLQSVMMGHQLVQS